VRLFKDHDKADQIPLEDVIRSAHFHLDDITGLDLTIILIPSF